MAFEHISVPDNAASIGVNRGFSLNVDSCQMDAIGFKPVSRGLVCKKFQHAIVTTVIRDTVV